MHDCNSDRDILHDFMMMKSRDDFENHKKNITINISSKTTRERKKNTTEIIVMKIHLAVTSMLGISIKKLFYQREFLWNLAWSELDAQFISNISIFRVHICFLDQIFSLCYLFL